MRGKERRVYADNQDITNLLSDFNNIGNFKYIERYSPLNGDHVILYNAVDIYNKDARFSSSLLRDSGIYIFESDARVNFRDIILTDGSGKRTVIDFLFSDDSIGIHLGGEVGNNVLVVSEIGTDAEDPLVLGHFKRFKKLIESKSVRIGLPGQPHYLMPGAVQKAKQGWRLAQGKGWSVDSDPVLPPEQLAKL